MGFMKQSSSTAAGLSALLVLLALLPLSSSSAQDLARRCNEMSARLAGDHPTRFGSFATLPLPDVKGTLLELVGPSQIVFGSDYPFAPAPVTEASVRGLASFGGFDVPQRAAIEQDNALALLPGLRARLERA